MKLKRTSKPKAIQPAKRGFDGLLGELREFITESRRQVLRAVDVVQVRTCWGVGQQIVEFEQGGAARAEYGAKLLPRLAVKLTEEFGRGFDTSNLHKMKQFYLAFPILDALRLKLSWSHYRALLRVEDEHAREWYAKKAETENWSSRALERQVSRLYYERLLSSKDRKAVRVKEAVAGNPELILSCWHIGRENLQAQKARARALKADIDQVLGTYRAESNVANGATTNVAALPARSFEVQVSGGAR